MSKLISDRMRRFFDISGVVADPPEGEVDDDRFMYLTRERLLAIFSHRERFFDAVPMFHPLRRTTLNALQTLADKGMIGLGGPPKKKAPCGSCSQKTIAVVFIQLLRHIQTLIALFEGNGTLCQLGDQLRAYLGGSNGRRLVVYLRGQHNVLRRVEF